MEERKGNAVDGRGYKGEGGKGVKGTPVCIFKFSLE